MFENPNLDQFADFADVRWFTLFRVTHGKKWALCWKKRAVFTSSRTLLPKMIIQCDTKPWKSNHHFLWGGFRTTIILVGVYQLSSSKRNHHFKNGGWLPGNCHSRIYPLLKSQKSSQFLCHKYWNNNVPFQFQQVTLVNDPPSFSFGPS